MASKLALVGKTSVPFPHVDFSTGCLRTFSQLGDFPLIKQTIEQAARQPPEAQVKAVLLVTLN